MTKACQCSSNPRPSFDELASQIRGQVHADHLWGQMLSTDGSIFEIEPAAVVYPKSTDDVVKTVEFAGPNDLSIHPRGSGSGLCGSAVGPGIIIDFTKYMNRLVHLDEENKTFTCQPGYRFGELEERLWDTGLFFPPDPSSGEYASFGGMFGTNASGAHSVKYGNVADYVLDAEIVLSNGQIVTLSEIERTPYEALSPELKELYDLYSENRDQIERAYPPVRYNVAGYNLRGMVQKGRLDLRRLFAGAEGTLGVVTRLTFQLIEKPKYDSLVVAFFDDIIASATAVGKILPMGPSGIEIMDRSLLDLARENDPRLAAEIPAGIDNVILVEFDGAEPDIPVEQARSVQALLSREGLTQQTHLALTPGEKARFWAVRRAAVPILYKLKGQKKILALIEDAAVPPESLVPYFRGIYEIMARHSVHFVTYGHIAKGLLHTRPLLDLKDQADVAKLKILADEVYELVSGLKGSVSGEHGDGRLRTPYIEHRYPEIYDLFVRVKTIFDPDFRFNPDIKIGSDPDSMMHNLRYGAEYENRDPGECMLQWPENFCREIEKCHGCSKCTTVTTATRMCPVYKFTRDETAAPKAKANLLRGLISGRLDDAQLYEKALKSVMDRCVACGSCYKECPSNVNIPKLAMEAKARYARRFGVKIRDRMLSDPELAGRTTRKISQYLKPVMENRFARKAADRLLGISERRSLAQFSPKSLFERVKPLNLPENRKGSEKIEKELPEDKQRIEVLYFSGCYAGYIRPEIGEAAIRVLNGMGMTVHLPEQGCCGLPMIAKGMAGEARTKVLRNLSRWGETLKKVDHLVVTCSSCGLSLMQEWGYLLDQKRISTVREKLIHISRLVLAHQDRLKIENCRMSLAYHNPCHLKVQPGPEASLEMLKLFPGVRATDLHSHCCGMSGTWGLCSEHYDLSLAIGTPMIEKLNDSDAEYGVTDCPTCRMQMEELSHKPILHPIEVADRCIEGR